MKIRESKLRQIIRKVIKEAWDPFAVTELKGDPSSYSTGDEPIATAFGKPIPMIEVVRGIVSWCEPKTGDPMSPEDRADWVYQHTNEACSKQGCRKHAKEIAGHALEELGLSEFKRTSTTAPHHGWHMSDR